VHTEEYKWDIFKENGIYLLVFQWLSMEYIPCQGILHEKLILFVTHQVSWRVKQIKSPEVIVVIVVVLAVAVAVAVAIAGGGGGDT